MFVFGLLLSVGSMAWLVGVYVWAYRERQADFTRKPPQEWRPLRYVPPRYLGMAAVGAVVGVMLVAASGR